MTPDDAQRQLAALAHVLQLIGRARDAADRSMLGFVAVNETRQLLVYRQSAVWLPGRGLVAVSGLPEPERNTPYGQWLDSVCRALAPSLGDGETLRVQAEALPAALARDWDDWLPAQLLALPWRDANGNLVAAWLLARDEAWDDAELALLRELAASYAHAWCAFERGHGWGRHLAQLMSDARRRRWLLGGVLALCLLPVRLSVLAPAEVVALDAFPVRVPLDGVVDRFHVRPNQPVRQGQPLFDLDTTSLDAQLAVARKDWEAASDAYRESAQMAVEGDVRSRLQLTEDRASMERKAEELAYSQRLLDRVRVRAARAGIAVFADPDDWVGRSVAVGEKVLEVADPRRVEVRIELPVADAIDLPPDAAVTLFLSTAPQYSYAARLRYQSYEAEPQPQGGVAYTLRAAFDPGQARPRLGLTGSARIYGHWVPLIYDVLRRPLAVARQWIGW